jgi:hypothetical protein
VAPGRLSRHAAAAHNRDALAPTAAGDLETAMHTLRPRPPAIAAFAAFAALVLLAGAADVEARPGGKHHGRGGYHAGHHSHGHGHWAPRRRSSVSIGIGLGWGGFYGSPWGPWGSWGHYPGYGVILPPPVVHYGVPPVAPPPEPVLAKGPPDPIFYPRHRQTAQQTEADIRECNRWALEQPNAIARADVFHRATLACMEGRDYVVR